MVLIARNPGRGLPAPRPYPDLARLGLRWIESGPYWIGYETAPLTIAGIFHETANIPGFY